MFCIYKYVRVLYIYTYRGIEVWYIIYVFIYSQFKIVCIELYYITIRKKVKHILAYYITFIEMSIFIPHQGSHRDYSIDYIFRYCYHMHTIPASVSHKVLYIKCQYHLPQFFLDTLQKFFLFCVCLL